MTPEYLAYTNARQRCLNHNHHSYPDYGGRGIEFRFTSFPEFLNEVGRRPKGRTLNRKNNDGHYEIGNVEWALYSVQNLNRRPFSEWKRKAA